MKKQFLGVAFLILMCSTGYGQFQVHPDSSFYTFLDSFYYYHQDDSAEGGFYNQVRRDAMIWGPRLAPHGKMSIATQAMNKYVKAYNSVPTASALNTTTTSAGTTVWSELGPNNNIGTSAGNGIGQIHRIAFHPNYGISNQIIYAGSHWGGLFRSENSGQLWSNHHTDQGLPITSVSGIAVTSNDDVFVCTGNGDFGSFNFGFNSNYSSLGPGSMGNYNPIYTQGVYNYNSVTEEWQDINNEALSQVVTFNKRMSFGQYAAVLSSLEVTDSCYYATGIVAPGVVTTTSLFAKFDTFGNEILHTLLPIDSGEYETWTPSLKTDNDGNLIVTAYWRDTISMHGSIIRYDHSGNLLSSAFFDSPYGIGEFMRPDDVQILPDSGYLLISSINYPNSGSDVSILRLDKNGNEVWHITRGTTTYVEGNGRIFIENDSSFIISYTKDNLSGVQMNYTVRNNIEKLDQAGNTVWHYESPITNQVYGPSHFLKSKDSGWVVTGAWGSEIPNGSGTYSLPVGEAYIYKLDNARNFLWGRKFYSDALFDAYFSRVIELEDSSLVAFGTVRRHYPQPNPTYYILDGRIVKLSPQGDSLWNREYEYLTTSSSQHYIYDAERTYDGGFLVCGEAKGTGAGVLQQGWLLKLDEHGCLVPGCHLALAVLPTAGVEDFRLSLYPNPVTDYLNVFYQTEKTGGELKFSVIDMQGRVLQSYTTADVSDKTYIVPVYELVTGMYILEVRRDGAIIQSEKFIKN